MEWNKIIRNINSILKRGWLYKIDVTTNNKKRRQSGSKTTFMLDKTAINKSAVNLDKGNILVPISEIHFFVINKYVVCTDVTIHRQTKE